MIAVSPFVLARDLWILFGVYWLVAAFAAGLVYVGLLHLTRVYPLDELVAMLRHRTSST